MDDQRNDPPEDQEDDQPLVRVYASGDQFAGRLMQGRLEAEGIPVLLKGEGDGPYHAGPVYLWVAASREADARDVVAAVESGAYAVDDEDANQKAERE